MSRGPDLTVEQVMTRPVVAVGTGETFGAMANLLRRHRISGLPVVDGEGRLVGVVSESDLLRRLVRAEVRKRFGGQTSEWRSRATAETAEGLMSQPAIATTPGAPAADALAVMRRRAVRRLPVIDEERRVVGIVTRTDLLEPYLHTDHELGEQLRGEILPRLGVDPAAIQVDIRDGNVLIAGTLAHPELVARLEEAVRDCPGVVFVESRLVARRRR